MSARILISPLSASRSVLSVSGNDAAKFLQGLVSNDILAASKPWTAPSCNKSIYAGVFTAQGRVTHDTFILPPSSTTTETGASSSAAKASDDATKFIIDHPRHADNPSLLRYLKRYILRSKVKARSMDDEWRLWAVYQDPTSIAPGLDAGRSAGSSSTPSSSSIWSRAEEELHSIAASNSGKWWKDGRANHMGYRLLLPTSALSAIDCERGRQIQHLGC